MSTCPMCHQEIPGMPEPEKVGTVVSCTCGDLYLKRPTTPSIAGQWVKVTAARGSARSFWLKVVAAHQGDGHELSILREGNGT